MKKFYHILTGLCCLPFISFAQQLVMPGDHPDPSVVKINNEYWASATSSNWFPAFPILHSKDLVHWDQRGYMFNQLPDWADYYLWAPEVTYDNGKVYVYYAAHKKGGNLCVGVASADKPEGPYTDLGPLVCQTDGSIDAFPMRDEKGALHLIWKEDGNSIKQPTPIWAQRMSEDRRSLIGEKRELFRNDQAWEHNLVEGVSMIRHGGYFYAFYAAAGCCGAGCNYITGVARAKSLLGPWEKNARGPLLTSSNDWNCPGHGTPVIRNGKYYFLYHGYDAHSTVVTGREGLLREFSFTPDGWVKFLPSAKASRPGWRYLERFGGKLDQGWQWSVFQSNPASVAARSITLTAAETPVGGYIGRASQSSEFMVTAKVNRKLSGGVAALGAIGDDKNALSVQISGDSIKVMQVKQGRKESLWAAALPLSNSIWLRMQSVEPGRYAFAYSTDGKSYKPLFTPRDGRFLPPWDRAVRVGLLSCGAAGSQAVFESFLVE